NKNNNISNAFDIDFYFFCKTNNFNYSKINDILMKIIRPAHLRKKYYNIYKDGNYNRFIYKSNYYIDREKLIRYDEALVNLLEYILFKEK
ncbi:MAG: hypothetical protein WCG67_01180, partial [Ferruginibacter sp.]